jgi:tellurite resistance protein TerC
MEAKTLLWIAFGVSVAIMLALDLGVFHRRSHAVGRREALTWTTVWIALSLVFSGVIWWFMGRHSALEFLTGYTIEKSLSLDNVFVFVLIFGAFAVPKNQQHHVLYWGVIGALLMRGVVIGAGSLLIARMHWLLYIFGAFLLLTGVRLMFGGDAEMHPERNVIYRGLAKLIPSTSQYHGGKFFVVENGRRLATPLFLVVLCVEAADLLFAIDSIPAIFAVTTDPLLVYSSNVFAILGLRALYFVLADVIEKFRYLKPALALILTFVGVKMVIAGVYKVSIVASLGVILGILCGAVALSMISTRRERIRR